MTALGEIRVEEREGCIALIVRMARPVWRWDVWTIVDVPNDRKVYDKHDARDLVYGNDAFRGVRGLQRYYCEHITSFAAKRGACLSRAGAERRARRHLERFLRWREKQRAIEAELEREGTATRHE
jgi:hypothetical protein